MNLIDAPSLGYQQGIPKSYWKDQSEINVEEYSSKNHGLPIKVKSDDQNSSEIKNVKVFDRNKMSDKFKVFNPSISLNIDKSEEDTSNQSFKDCCKSEKVRETTNQCHLLSFKSSDHRSSLEVVTGNKIMYSELSCESTGSASLGTKIQTFDLKKKMLDRKEDPLWNKS